MDEIQDWINELELLNLTHPHIVTEFKRLQKELEFWQPACNHDKCQTSTDPEDWCQTTKDKNGEE